MSTLETAIVFSTVMLVLCGFIVLPADLCADTINDASRAIEDVVNVDRDTLSQEKINTFLTGISENYRIIYGTILGEASDEEE